MAFDQREASWFQTAWQLLPRGDCGRRPGKYDEIAREYLCWDKTHLLPSNLTGCVSHGQRGNAAAVRPPASSLPPKHGPSARAHFEHCGANIARTRALGLIESCRAVTHLVWYMVLQPHTADEDCTARQVLLFSSKAQSNQIKSKQYNNFIWQWASACTDPSAGLQLEWIKTVAVCHQTWASNLNTILVATEMCLERWVSKTVKYWEIAF